MDSYATYDNSAGFFAALSAYWFIFAIILVFMVVCNWLIYQKMCGQGWPSIVPIYNNWVLCRNTWGHGAMMFTFFIPFVGGIFQIVTLWKMYTGFGKSTGFKILSLFFPLITMAIVAFNSDEYYAPY